MKDPTYESEVPPLPVPCIRMKLYVGFVAQGMALDGEGLDSSDRRCRDI